MSYRTGIKSALTNLIDLERGICRIQYRKCSPYELVSVLLAFQRYFCYPVGVICARVSQTAPTFDECKELHSTLLKDLLPIPNVEKSTFLSEFFSHHFSVIAQFLSQIDTDTAIHQGNITSLFKDASQHAEILSCKEVRLF